MVMLTDTSVWIAHFRDHDIPQVAHLRRQIEAGGTPIGDLVVMELLRGMAIREAVALERRLLSLNLYPMGASAVILQSGRNYQFLRQRGFTVRSSIDCIIATYCIQEGHSLLHNDRDFDPFEEFLGLEVVHP